MYRLLFSLLLLLATSACSAATNTPDAAKTPINGKVVYVAVEGGFYGLVSEDGQRYLPTDLPREFRQDGLPVRVRLEPLPATVGFRMWGTKVRLLTIERR